MGNFKELSRAELQQTNGAFVGATIAYIANKVEGEKNIGGN